MLSPAALSVSQRGFPPPLDSYGVEEGLSLLGVLAHRARLEPLNVVATIAFALAIVHTFAAPSLLAASHHQRERLEREHGPGAHSFRVEILHFLGEIEAVFGIWAVPLLLVVTATKGWAVAETFVVSLSFSEPVLVVVIMAISSTRPVLAFAERVVGAFARLGGGSPLSWWMSVLSVGPLLGSLITEPAAMVISALLLGQRVFDLQPSRRLRYGTLGLLFVNVSAGGTLTHFAAPPVLMVAARWGWDTPFMAAHFGWKAVFGILVANVLYGLVFRRELRSLAGRSVARAPGLQAGEAPVPAWITAVHLALLALTVVAAHTPAMVVGVFLFFLAFQKATAPHQDELALGPPILVGFFLAGLVVHGSFQQWWIEPVLSRLGPVSLKLGAMALTAFNDNAAITYLASLVPSFSEEAKYAVVAAAVAGGGLTVIANAPNPAGQAALARYFDEGILPLGLFLGALVPTAVIAAAFFLLP